MYFYRSLPDDLKAEGLHSRRLSGYPLHAPPHLRESAGWFLINAATYEHQPQFTTADLRLWLLGEILQETHAGGVQCAAWDE
jgi:hypothetical protein